MYPGGTTRPEVSMLNTRPIGRLPTRRSCRSATTGRSPSTTCSAAMWPSTSTASSSTPVAPVRGDSSLCPAGASSTRASRSAVDGRPSLTVALPDEADERCRRSRHHGDQHRRTGARLPCRTAGRRRPATTSFVNMNGSGPGRWRLRRSCRCRPPASRSPRSAAAT